VEVSSPAPHTTRRLLAIDPDMSEPLTVQVLCHLTLSFVGFNPDDDMTKVSQFKYFRRLLIACESHQKDRDIISLEVAFRFGSGGRHMSRTDGSEA
jgi:hypothetical protein